MDRRSRALRWTATADGGVRWASAFVALFVLTLATCFEFAAADDVSVPVSMQVELTTRIAAYDRTLVSRAGDRVRVVVIARRSNAVSERIASQVEAQFRRTDRIAGLPVETLKVTVDDAAGVAAAVRENRATIAFLAAGFSNEVPAIASRLAGTAVLTISAVGEDAGRGAVVAFEIDASRPRIVVNLGQAQRQQLQLSSQLLRLARVIR